MAAMYNCGILIVRLAFPEFREGVSIDELPTVVYDLDLVHKLPMKIFIYFSYPNVVNILPVEI